VHWGIALGNSRTCVLLAAAFVMLAAAPAPTLAQSGSMGGSIGKHEKTITGTEPAARPERHHKRAAPKSSEAPTTTRSCGNVTGNWSWFNGGSTAITKDGKTLHTTGEHGVWHCSGSTLVINWDAGWVDRLQLNASGSELSGNNQFGVAVSGVRR